ncbi:hypothetical protein VNO77_03795 [Canavalia gladiata]|uniref:Uncharacterized protein n=1 Tax=Canavalia gladiata TaxID=3824 RepID=A0AAN9N0I2_CANGL
MRSSVMSSYLICFQKIELDHQCFLFEAISINSGKGSSIMLSLDKSMQGKLTADETLIWIRYGFESIVCGTIDVFETYQEERLPLEACYSNRIIHGKGLHGGYCRCMFAYVPTRSKCLDQCKLVGKFVLTKAQSKGYSFGAVVQASSKAFSDPCLRLYMITEFLQEVVLKDHSGLLQFKTVDPQNRPASTLSGLSCSSKGGHVEVGMVVLFI